MIKPYYQDSAVALYHGNSYELLPSLAAETNFQLMLTDPPYEMEMGGAGCFKDRQYKKDIEGFTDGGFDMSILDACPNWFCFCSKDQLVELMQRASVRRWMLLTWNKSNPTPFVNQTYLPDTEYIVHSFQVGRLFGEYADKARYIYRPATQNKDHPNEKPIEVLAKLIRLGTEQGDTIVDPFGGSGMTGVAAKSLGRKCVLIEREEWCCEVAARKLGQEWLGF
jgi:site-specific DNA-methyltransferase (adenine-specific)